MNTEKKNRCNGCGICNDGHTLTRILGKETYSPRNALIQIGKEHSKQNIFTILFDGYVESTCPAQIQFTEEIAKERARLHKQGDSPAKTKAMQKYYRKHGSIMKKGQKPQFFPE